MRTAPTLCLICLALSLAACDKHDEPADLDAADQNDAHVPAAQDPHPLPLVPQVPPPGNPNATDPNKHAHDPNCADPNGTHGTAKSGIMHVTPHPHAAPDAHPHK